METGKFICKGKYYISTGFLSQDVHYARAYDIVVWRTGWHNFTSSDGRTYRLVLGRFYVQFCVNYATHDAHA